MGWYPLIVLPYYYLLILILSIEVSSSPHISTFSFLKVALTFLNFGLIVKTNFPFLLTSLFSKLFSIKSNLGCLSNSPRSGGLKSVNFALIIILIFSVYALGFF